MKEYYLNTEQVRDYCSRLRIGDKVYLSGYVYTARDAAHKRIFELLNNDCAIPFDIKNSVIFYAGPTPWRCRCFGGTAC